MLDSVEELRIDEYEYSLPAERIAQQPIAPPEKARLLVWNGAKQDINDSTFGALNDWLPRGSVLVFNNTKVVPARIELHKSTGARIEVFLLEPSIPRVYEECMSATQECTWHALVGNAKKWGDEVLEYPLAGGEMLFISHTQEADGKTFAVYFRWTGGECFSAILQKVGQIPIPPYLNRATQEEDSYWYQTVYAQWEGSVAAPTAGLHFSEAMLSELSTSGHELLYTTLHVGAGTFLPVKSETIGGHTMHAERIVVQRDFLERLRSAKGKIVAVGTTSLRTLESIYWYGVLLQYTSSGVTPSLGQWIPYQMQSTVSRTTILERLLAHLDRSGASNLELTTSLLIAPSYTLRMADALITNFHQPGSTLLLLVSAIVGENWKRIYQHALEQDYRFLSYGDGCLLL